MRGTTFIQRVAACLAVLGFCIPQVALAETVQINPAAAMADVQLHEGGVLLGQVVTPENAPTVNVQVSLRSGDRELAVTMTDHEGRFEFRGLNDGVYQIVTANGQGTYRVWSQAAAPPSAQLGATVRGQHHFGQFKYWMSNPWIVAGIIAAAVAIPVAIHNSKKPSSP